MRFRTWLVVVALAWCSWEQPAHAYLDPGSGSMLLQVILGGVAAAGVVLRLFWQRIAGGLRRDQRERTD